MAADFFTHLRAIRSSEDRLKLLRAAREAYLRAMREYLTQLQTEIDREEAALTEAHTNRVSGSASCPPIETAQLLPLSRLRHS